MTAVKPAPDHPWRRGFLTKKVNDHIKQSIVNSFVNNWIAGGALLPWNGRK
ncbi:hypothetical protein [Brevibacillus formosus]|uniref:hypothetical protein n=1 Tax=Brevibacillus formosus TaxID=54913 RepID=UPI001304EB1A|nr:hypothetical protein [Brevibacillus formosus]